jgi:hypothetical protein
MWPESKREGLALGRYLQRETVEREGLKSLFFVLA